jgi:predicted HicB family RNase H-like nuclease
MDEFNRKTTMDLLSHKGYSGSVETSITDNVLHGKILFINDLVTYEADNIPQLKGEFVAAVNDYLDTCAQVGKIPQKSCSGQFNVRVTPELHRLAHQRASEEGTSLNAVTASALECYLKPPARRNYSQTDALYPTSANVVTIRTPLGTSEITHGVNAIMQSAINAASNTVIDQSIDQKYAH